MQAEIEPLSDDWADPCSSQFETSTVNTANRSLIHWADMLGSNGDYAIIAQPPTVFWGQWHDVSGESVKEKYWPEPGQNLARLIERQWRPV